MCWGGNVKEKSTSGAKRSLNEDRENAILRYKLEQRAHEIPYPDNVIPKLLPPLIHLVEGNTSAPARARCRARPIGRCTARQVLVGSRVDCLRKSGSASGCSVKECAGDNLVSKWKRIINNGQQECSSRLFVADDLMIPADILGTAQLAPAKPPAETAVP